MKIVNGIHSNHSRNGHVVLRAVLAVGSLVSFLVGSLVSVLLASGPVALWAVLAVGAVVCFMLAFDTLCFPPASDAEGHWE